MPPLRPHLQLAPNNLPLPNLRTHLRIHGLDSSSTLVEIVHDQTTFMDILTKYNWRNVTRYTTLWKWDDEGTSRVPLDNNFAFVSRKWVRENSEDLFVDWDGMREAEEKAIAQALARHREESWKSRSSWGYGYGHQSDDGYGNGEDSEEGGWASGSTSKSKGAARFKASTMTGIVLASNNPQVQFTVVDTSERLIAAWKSDRPPIAESGIEDILFDDECLAIEGADNETTTAKSLASKDELEVTRRRKIQNLSFSSDVHAAVASAQMLFLCLEMDEFDTSFAYLEPTLAAIAAASTGPKIIVQRATSPYGTVRHIKERLESLAPNIHHTILANPLPSFPPPGCSISSPLTEPRVIIGHIYSSSSRPEDTDALKKLYTPFIPAERIVTMDAYSAELGRFGGSAMLAQQMCSLASLSVLSGTCEASQGAVGWMLGCGTAARSSDAGPQLSHLSVGGGFKEIRSEVKCLVSIAKEMGIDEVAEYWVSLLRMQEFLVRRAVKGLIQELRTDERANEATTAIAVLGFDDEREMGTIVVKELRNAGLNVKVLVLGNNPPSKQVECEPELGEGIDAVKSIEAACSECSGVVLLSATSVQAEGWQKVAASMKDRKVLSLCGYLDDGVKMKQLGFEVL
ncbi:hypothetical protein BJX62DRAFT_236342 [Aspergillus germanicus]